MRNLIIFISLIAIINACTVENNPVDLQSEEDSNPPQIDSVSKTEMSVSENFTVFGKNFSQPPTELEVKINDLSCDILIHIDTLISAKVPSEAQSGDLSVIVNGQQSNAVNIIITSANRPIINNLDRYSGSPGQLIAIYGENFGDDMGDGFISIGETQTTTSDIELWQDDLIRFSIPTGSTSGKISVTNSDGVKSVEDIDFEII